MKCKECGFMEQESEKICSNCQSSLEEPIIIKYSEKKQFFDVKEFTKSLGKDYVVLLSFLGGVFIYLSPFFSWIWKSLSDEKVKSDLFNAREVFIGRTEGIRVIGGIVAFIGLVVIVLSAEKNITFLEKIKVINKIKLILFIIVVLFSGYIFLHSPYKEVIDIFKDAKKEFQILSME